MDISCCINYCHIKLKYKICRLFTKLMLTKNRNIIYYLYWILSRIRKIVHEICDITKYGQLNGDFTVIRIFIKRYFLISRRR